jgi:DNA-binding response OmpR family regulator
MAATALRKSRVLLVEDQPLIREYVRSGLHSVVGGCITVGDYDGFIREVSKNPYDLIILDYALPRVTGLEILYGIRSGGFPCPYDIRAVMITGHNDAYVVGQAGKFDIDGLLAKPFSIKQLSQRIERVLQKSSAKEDVTYYQICLDQQVEAIRAERQWSPGTLLRTKPLWFTLKELENAHKHPTQEEIEIIFLKPGMRLAESVYSESGQLLIGEGIALSERVIHRLRQMSTENPQFSSVSIITE